MNSAVTCTFKKFTYGPGQDWGLHANPPFLALLDPWTAAVTAIVAARAKKSAREAPKLLKLLVVYNTVKFETAGARPLLSWLLKLMHPLQPPTQSWNPKSSKIKTGIVKYELKTEG